MHTWLRVSVGLTVGCLLWATTAQAQSRPGCEQGSVKTPAQVGGEVTKIDAARGRVTVRESDGTVYEFQASTDTLRDLKVGGRVEARLRDTPKC